MFVHRINWPRTRCITYRKRGNRGSWPSISKKKKYAFSDTWEEGKMCFFSFRFDKNCKSELQRDAEKLSRESANWNCFLTSFHFLLWQGFDMKTCTEIDIICKFQKVKKRLRFRKKNQQKKKQSISWCLSSLMRQVGLSRKGSVKSLQGNKGTKLFYCLLSFLLKRFK